MYTLPDLPYNYDALAPTISEDIMKLHHSKHHQTYVDKLNAALEEAPDLKQATLVELLSDIGNLPDSVRMAIRNHGGGHYNHSLFWEIMAPQAGGEPQGKLGDAIREKWGSFEAFTDEFNSKDMAKFIFENLMILLRDEEEDLGFFKVVLKRTFKLEEEEDL